MNKNFRTGFEKIAKEENHYIRRALLGNPLSAAIEAEKGKKTKAWGEARKHMLGQSTKGFGLGATLGIGAGGLATLLSKGKIKPLKSLAVGGGVGAILGSGGGNIKGQFDEEATKLHNKYSKNK